MKKTTFILAALLSAACISAQETLTLEQCIIKGLTAGAVKG